ncbi:hypothetical protein BK126_09740 [Paenibacillus sp. FSL H7-0326]|uniref:hypothetical protein n=1 Tax=Paenibacillus sp. FSL H7-0326 TaxID=1921144 RepID=UPI00096FFA12|nr:hypothetical protein [Paenibacillus sp. FSL H7-0326]OMC72255.1 hypothetical protein BK126_09740 [Paenibacillus sp. FSL H7-0326]
MNLFNLFNIPVPYIVIDAELSILSCSDSASHIYEQAVHFTDWLDEGSISKAKRYISPVHSGTRVELIMNTRKQPFSLYDIYQQWDEQGNGHLICIEQLQNIQLLSDKLQLLHEDLQQLPSPIHQEADRPQASKTSRRSARERELRSTLETIRDLVDMLYPSLIEIDRTIYADIIKNQIEEALAEPAADNVHPISSKFNDDRPRSKN